MIASSRLKAREVGWSIVLVHERDEIVVERALNPLLDRAVAAILEHLRRLQQRRARRAESRARRRRARELRSVEQIARDVLASRDFFLEAARQVANASVHASTVNVHRPSRSTRKFAEPSVGVEIEVHRRDGPVVVARALEQRSRAEKIVAVLDEIGADRHRVADDALRRISSSIHLRRDALDDDFFQSSRCHVRFSVGVRPTLQILLDVLPLRSE